MIIFIQLLDAVCDCDRDNIWLQPSSLILAALHNSTYPRIHMCTDTAWGSQWQCREEMVLEGCQAGSSEWPYMVKSAVSRTERQKRQRQRQPSSTELWNTNWEKYGERPGILFTPTVFLCVETVQSSASRQTGGSKAKMKKCVTMLTPRDS